MAGLERTLDMYKLLKVGSSLALTQNSKKRLIAKGAELLYAVIYVGNRAAESLFRGELGTK